jgi:hypothetical protein
MLKLIKEHWRKSKNFHSSFIACLFVNVLFGIYLTQLLNQTQLPIWNDNIIGNITLTIFLVILLGVGYKWGISNCDDIKDTQTFYDNFFMSVMIVIISTVLIVYNPFLKVKFNWILGLMSILIIYFPLNWSYIKLRPK